ncbi:hypothetical protein B2J93_6382 [Marssonina coronariae]|uniref:Telomeric single stranded DNA binding POT1/Cdc13 domain-containing protein n=1 Tax=Diplocarpon coronariae TaxID=2795749 RepID=A0A218Z0A3_9HELO|nr:hypothetical protein B2J93_6382 [Marssonina coronariae]
MEGETTTGAIALESTVQTAIADLSPEIPALYTKSIKAVVTLTWPYSSATGSLAFLLSEPDFRLRRAKGQVRVQFFGSSAKAIKEYGIASGDQVVLCLDGVEWVPNDPNAVAPGRGIEWELRFMERLLLEVGSHSLIEMGLANSWLQFKQEDADGTEKININHPVTSEEIPAPAHTSTGLVNPTSPINNGISSNQSLGITNGDLWSSPAFLKRTRTSYGSMFESNYDPFAEDGIVQGKGPKRSRLSSTAWRYTSQSPTPEAEATEVNTTATSTEPPPKPAPTMTDEACQTVDFGDRDAAEGLANFSRQATNVESATYSTAAEPIFLDQTHLQVDDSLQSNQETLPRLPTIHTELLDLEVVEEDRFSPRIPSSPRLQAVPSDALSLVSPLLSIKHSPLHQHDQPSEEPQKLNVEPEATAADASLLAEAEPEKEDIYGASPADRPSQDPEPEYQGLGNSMATRRKIGISIPHFEDQYAAEDQYGHWQNAEARLGHSTSPSGVEISRPGTHGDCFHGIRDETQQTQTGHLKIAAEKQHSEYSSPNGGMLGQLPSAWGSSSVVYPDFHVPESSAYLPPHSRSAAMSRSQSEHSATSAVVDPMESDHEPDEPVEGPEDDLNACGEVDGEENERKFQLQHSAGQQYDFGGDDDDGPEDLDGSHYSADYGEGGFQVELEDANLSEEGFDENVNYGSLLVGHNSDPEDVSVGDYDENEDDDDDDDEENDEDDEKCSEEQDLRGALPFQRQSGYQPEVIDLLSSDEDADGDETPHPSVPTTRKPRSPPRQSQELTSCSRRDEEESDENDDERKEDANLEYEFSSVPYTEQSEIMTSIASNFKAGGEHYDPEFAIMDGENEGDEDNDRNATFVKDDLVKAQEDHKGEAEEEDSYVQVVDENQISEAEDENGHAQVQDHNLDIETAEGNLLAPVVLGALKNDLDEDESAQAVEQDQDMEDEKMHFHETEVPFTVGSVHDGYEGGDQNIGDLEPNLQAPGDEQDSIPEEAEEVQTPGIGQESIALELDRPVKPAVEQSPEFPEISPPRPSLFSRMFDGANDEPQFGASYTSISKDETGLTPSKNFGESISHFSDGLSSNQLNCQFPTPDETQNPNNFVSTEASPSHVSENQQLSDDHNNGMELDLSDELLLNERTGAATLGSSPVEESQSINESATVLEEHIEVEKIQTTTISFEDNNEEMVDNEDFNAADDLQLEVAVARQQDVKESRQITDTEVTETVIITETVAMSLGELESLRSDGFSSCDGVADSNVKENEEEDVAIVEPDSSFETLRRSTRSVKPTLKMTANAKEKIRPGTPARALTPSADPKENTKSTEKSLPVTPAKSNKQPLSSADFDGMSPMVVIDTRASLKGHDASIEFALEANDSPSPPRHNLRKQHAATEAIKPSPPQHNLRKHPPATLEAAESSPPPQHNLRNRTISATEAIESSQPTQQNLRNARLTTSEVASSSPSQHDVHKSGVVDSKMRLLRALRTDLTQFSTLKVLKFQINKKLDFLALVTTAPPDPVRAKKGPRQYQITFNITDPSIAPTHVVEVQVFRPYKAALPIVKPGDGILLRNFQVMSVQSRGGFALRSTQDEASSWAVFKKDNSEVDVRGPPVEYGDGEKNHVSQLKEWYEALDETALAKIARANVDGPRYTIEIAVEALGTVPEGGTKEKMLRFDDVLEWNEKLGLKPRTPMYSLGNTTKRLLGSEKILGK